MKRFVETTDWRDPAYRRLSPQAKQVRRYLWDNCDCAGTIAMDLEAITFHVGELIEEKHVAELGGWLERLPDGRMLIPSFIHFQSGELSDDCRAHLPILKTIQAHKLVRCGILYHHSSHSLSGTPPLSPDRGPLQLQLQEQEKEKEQEELKALPETLRSLTFLAAWKGWQTHRREIRHKLTPKSVEQQLKQLSELGEARAIACLNLSIGNGWRGLFPEKIKGANGKPVTTLPPVLKVKRL